VSRVQRRPETSRYRLDTGAPFAVPPASLLRNSWSSWAMELSPPCPVRIPAGGREGVRSGVRSSDGEALELRGRVRHPFESRVDQRAHGQEPLPAGQHEV